MAERICPNCGKTVPDSNYCAECGKPLPKEAGAEVSTTGTPASTAPGAPEAAGPPPPPSAGDARAPAPPLDGQLRCPDCGEAVYEGERVCWNCSRRLETASEAGEPPVTPVHEPASGAPTTPPVSPQVGPQPAGVAAPTPSSATRPQQRLPRRASAEAMSYAWWSFGLGLLSVFTCGVLGLLGLAALWLGVAAARRDAGPVAIAGAVFGALGLLVFLAWVVALAIAMPQLMHPGSTHIMIPNL